VTSTNHAPLHVGAHLLPCGSQCVPLCTLLPLYPATKPTTLLTKDGYWVTQITGYRNTGRKLGGGDPNKQEMGPQNTPGMAQKTQGDNPVAIRAATRNNKRQQQTTQHRSQKTRGTPKKPITILGFTNCMLRNFISLCTSFGVSGHPTQCSSLSLTHLSNDQSHGHPH
jgi:hypothetical protein